MGYFANALIFDAPADWEKLQRAISPITRLTGYRHISEAVWLVDLWEPSERDHWPFTESISESAIYKTTIAPDSQAALRTLAKLADWDSAYESQSGYVLIKTAAEIAAATGLSFRCFAGDDEGTNVAAAVGPEGIVRFSTSLSKFSVEYDGEQVGVIPLLDEHEPQFNLTAKELKQLQGIPGANVKPPRVRNDADGFYGHGIAFWPVGDPTELLGLGTWDPFENIDSDWPVEFEGHGAGRGPASKSPEVSSKPWWRIWG